MVGNGKCKSLRDHVLYMTLKTWLAIFPLIWLVSPPCWNAEVLMVRNESDSSVYKRNALWNSPLCALPNPLSSLSVMLWTSLYGWLWIPVVIYGGEGTGDSLQYSCLENPMDGGAWWAAVYGVAQSQTQLTWLSSNEMIKMIKVILTLQIS